MSEYFTDWLKSQVKGRYRSFRQFARTAGIEETLFYHILHGYQYPSPYTLSLIFKALGTDRAEQKDVVWQIWREKAAAGSTHKF